MGSYWFFADFDPEDGPAHRSDEDSGLEDSGDGLTGTEHYAAVGYINSFALLGILFDVVQ